MGRNDEKFIVDVVPLTRIPLIRGQFFHYLAGHEIAPGALVQVSLFSRKVEGVVLASRKDFTRAGGIKLKPVEKIIEENFLTRNQLVLAQFISEYYISPLGVVMKGFVPKRNKRLKISDLRLKTEKKDILLTRGQSEAVSAIVSSKSKKINKKFLLFGPSASGKTEVYIHAIKDLRKKDPDKQFLILLPEQTLAPQAVERYGQYFKPDEMAILSSNITKGQYYSSWQRIKSGHTKIVIGTRMAVFAPFQNLGLIIIDEEQDVSFKQWDMNPRYDACMVAEKLAEIFRCPLVRGSATPSVESYYRTIKKELELLELPALDIANMNINQPHKASGMISDSLLVDMKKERWEKNYSAISKKLKNELAYALKNEQQAILIVNRQGMSVFSVCANCQAVLRCPKCDRALIYQNRGNYGCIHCTYKTSITPECQKCHGISFKNIGIGTQKVEREVRELFSKASIARIDSQAIRSMRNYSTSIYDKFSNGEIDILIGTQMVSKNWDLPRVSLVGIIDADNLFSVPDFSTDEKAFSLIVQAAGRVSRPGSRFRGVVIIQTFHPENPILKLAAEKSTVSFLKKEVEERKMLKLGPYYNAIRIFFSDRNPKKVESECQRVKKILKSIERIIISDIFQPLSSNIRGRYRQQLVIKFQQGRPKKLEEALKKLGPGWAIDVDPINLL